ncbi:polysaccharide biosynthesis/export family protein [Citromicrobium bathyomarinum]|uniref:polysaccharide biosynthesis/export family protein n=1 Tax=Citromicrobium bathyomarinum TaxID=72174 RepID=UPI00315A9FD2
MTHKFGLLALLCLSALALGGCATTREIAAAPGIEATDLQSLPAPKTGAYYGLRPLDSLQIAVRQDETLGGTYVVETDGYIDYPYLGRVYAAGLLPGELANRIAAGLNPRFVLNPDVTVRVSSERAPTISIGGQVATPGNVSVIQAPTLMRAVNMAGGTTEYAKLDDVLIFREVDGRKYIGVYNLSAIYRGNYEDPALYPDDIVMVGDSPARRRAESLLQLFSLAITPVILVDRLVN